MKCRRKVCILSLALQYAICLILEHLGKIRKGPISPSCGLIKAPGLIHGSSLRHLGVDPAIPLLLTPCVLFKDQKDEFGESGFLLDSCGSILSRALSQVVPVLVSKVPNDLALPCYNKAMSLCGHSNTLWHTDHSQLSSADGCDAIDVTNFLSPDPFWSPYGFLTYLLSFQW